MMDMSKNTGDRNIKNTCRVCLDTILSDSVLLQPGNNWLEQYEYCFGLTVKEYDEPRKLCLICVENMKEFVNFKKKCHDSHHYWKTIKSSDLESYSEDHKVKEEIDEPLVKEETINEENATSNFDDIVEKLSTIDDHFEDSISYQYDEIKEEETVCDIVPKQIENPKQIITRGRRKYNRKAKKDTEVMEIKSNSHHCGLCDFNSTDAQETTQHLKDHSMNNELVCKICNYEGFDFSDMITHRYEHIPKGSQLRGKYCPECNKRFHCLKRLQFHHRAEHMRKRGGWCGLCSMSFNVFKTWRKHEKLRHENAHKFICDHCGRAYLYRNQIVEHLQDVAGVKRVVCDSCGSGFKRSSYLSLHMRTVHKNDAVKCDHCGVTYKNKYRLQYHLKMVAREKQFICKICSKAFYHAVTLKKHEFFHTGERPFSCETCGKSLKKKGELKIHMERHMGIRRFKCTVCPKDFVTSTQLKVHSAVHTGVRRHKCQRCERSFHSRKLLAAHCLAKHNMDVD